MQWRAARRSSHVGQGESLVPPHTHKSDSINYEVASIMFWALGCGAPLQELVAGGAFQSSTFQLNVSTFCGIRWGVPVTTTAQVEQKSGRR